MRFEKERNSRRLSCGFKEIFQKMTQKKGESAEKIVYLHDNIIARLQRCLPCEVLLPFAYARKGK
jgi:hypothetical protein